MKWKYQSDTACFTHRSSDFISAEIFPFFPPFIAVDHANKSKISLIKNMLHLKVINYHVAKAPRYVMLPN